MGEGTIGFSLKGFAGVTFGIGFVFVGADQGIKIFEIAVAKWNGLLFIGVSELERRLCGCNSLS